MSFNFDSKIYKIIDKYINLYQFAICGEKI